MSIKNKLTRYLPKQLVFSFLGMGVLLVLFTNMGGNPEFLLQLEAPPVKVESKIENILNLIDDTDDYIAKGKVSKKAISLHKSHKIYLINKVAQINRAENCDELIDLVPSVESGTYLLFTEKGDNPSLVGCDYKNKKMVKEIVIAKAKKPEPKLVSSEIKGNVDSVTLANNQVEIKGWACDTGIEKTTSVELYVGNLAGQGGKLVASSKATLASEAAVRKACGVTKGNYRYVINLTTAQARAIQGKAVYVYGISLSGGSNNLLTKSGQMKIPAITSEIRGYVDNVRILNNQVVINGWACNSGVEATTSVHLYVGKPGGQGNKALASNVATRVSEDAVRKACGVANGNYRYAFYLTMAQAKAIKGQPVFVHGISLTGGVNKLLTKSGQMKIP